RHILGSGCDFPQAVHDKVGDDIGLDEVAKPDPLPAGLLHGVAGVLHRVCRAAQLVFQFVQFGGGVVDGSAVGQSLFGARTILGLCLVQLALLGFEGVGQVGDLPVQDR